MEFVWSLNVAGLYRGFGDYLILFSLKLRSHVRLSFVCGELPAIRGSSMAWSDFGVA